MLFEYLLLFINSTYYEHFLYKNKNKALFVIISTLIFNYSTHSSCKCYVAKIHHSGMCMCFLTIVVYCLYLVSLPLQVLVKFFIQVVYLNVYSMICILLCSHTLLYSFAQSEWVIEVCLDLFFKYKTNVFVDSESYSIVCYMSIVWHSTPGYEVNVGSV
jgi:hypothetical protein